MERCVTQLILCLNLDTFVETAVLADRVNHQGLLNACLEFALREENRCAHHLCLSSCATEQCFAMNLALCLRSAAEH